VERLKAGEDPNLVAREEMPRYRYFNKVIEDGKIMRKVLGGLIRRRSAEIQYFCMIRRGMNGKVVKNIQKMLKKIMLYYYEIDSIFGEETEKSVIEFQKCKPRLIVTGMVDEWTRLELETAYNNWEDDLL